MRPRRPARRGFDFDLRDHGIPVRSGSLLCIKPHRHPVSGRESLYLGYCAAPSVIVRMDPATGRCEQFNAKPPCSAPWDMEFAPDGKVLVTSVDGSLSCLDPSRKRFPVVAKADAWFWSITRATDGKYYLGTSSLAKLYRYDYAAGTLDDLGPVDPVQKYLRVVKDGGDGFLYGSIGCTAAQVVAWELVSGRVTRLLPEAEAVPGFHSLGRGADGGLYVQCVSGRLYRLQAGTATPIAAGDWPGWMPLTLSSGETVRYVDPDVVEFNRGRKRRAFPVRYETPGAGIFHLALGPDRTVYGSTIMPLYLFRHRAGRKKAENLGRGGPDNGEAYSFGACGGKLYYGTYSTGKLMVYDPKRPWQPGSDEKGWKRNPKLIGSLGEGHCRPRAMCVDPKKRVWIGSYAEYGRSSGGLACYDTVSRRLTNNPVVIPDQSIVSLAADASGNMIYGGTDIVRGSGTDPCTKEARLFAWDAAKRKVLWDFVPVPGENGIINLLFLNGKLYGSTRPRFTFFVANPETRAVEKIIPSAISAVREQSMSVASDGNIYGITWMALFRWRPDGDVETLWRLVGRPARKYGGSLFHRGAAIVGPRLYFSCGARVMSVRLPLERR